MIRVRCTATVLGALAAISALAIAASASASKLQPKRGKVYFGTTDTGVVSQFADFADAVGKHPAVIETFQHWDGKLTGSVKRWQQAEARPILHISTADPNDGHELITLRGIARGRGDDYLIGLNHLFWSNHMRAYVRPLGEPNRCLNVYSSYNCGGRLRDGLHRPWWYKQAFRRIYIVLHGGGTVARIDARLAKTHLPPLRSAGVLPTHLPRAPVAVVWSPLPAGAPATRANRPDNFFPGVRYTDWAGTDFYSAYPDWKGLKHLYNRYRHKPFVLTEWGVEDRDNPTFVRRVFAWVHRHRRCRMLVYYQDFGSSNPYRIQNFPASLAVIHRRLASHAFPAFAPAHPTPPPPPPPPPPPSGGLAP
jgi:hypothetical protein